MTELLVSAGLVSLVGLGGWTLKTLFSMQGLFHELSGRLTRFVDVVELRMQHYDEDLADIKENLKPRP